MGLKTLWTIYTEYTQSKKFNSKRFKANIIEAAEQCDFNNIPEIREPENFKNILTNCSQLSVCLDGYRQDTLFNPLPLFHAFGLTATTLLPLIEGTTVSTKDGVIKRKPYHCTEHNREELAKKHNQPTYAILVHPYLKNRKDYCENVDGRLGYKCTTTIVYRGQLEVDHIDGNPYNHSKENLQTLCNCCHTYKTHISRDRET